MPSQTPRPALRGRRQQLHDLDELLRDVRAGRSRVLVLRGEAGVGKTALLEHVIGSALPARVVHTAGAEAETEIAYAALQQLCAPLLDHLEALPAPQRAALSTAFGLGPGEPPTALVVGLAVLGLFAEAASDQPLVCVVDDAQWLDRMSEVVLTFVARRLDAESVALVFGVRDADEPRALVDLPALHLGGLPPDEARALLDSVLTVPIEDQVRERIVAETRGNPLALLELPRSHSPAELAFGFGSQAAARVEGLVEAGFARRIAALPDATRQFLLVAALEPVGDTTLLWRAVERLGIAPDAGGPAEAAELVEVGARVRFRHPLVRSAAWRSADPAELRDAHRVLADVTDPTQEPDRRAWHRAHATVGPDEAVAAELEQSADRALSRGGRAAAAAFLERAAELTPDPKTRATRLLAAARAGFAAGALAKVSALLSAAELGPLEPAQRAEVERLRATVTFTLSHARESGPVLLAAARRLDDLDPVAARETYLNALGAAIEAGRLGDDDLRVAARAARAVPPGDEPAGLLLTGLTTWALDGQAAAVAPLRRALAAIRTDDDLRLVWLAAMVVHEVWDDVAWDDLTARAVRAARASGAMSLLPDALVWRAGPEVAAGRFTAASDLLDEAATLLYATGQPSNPAARLTLAAHQGDERPAAELIDATIRAAETGAQGRLLGLALYARAQLLNGLGRYQAAFEAAQRASAYTDLSIDGWTLCELIEAASRTGHADAADAARRRLAERTRAAGTQWALGVQALADALAGPPGATESRYREAIERIPADRIGIQHARARLLFGEWLRRENRRSEARTELRAAHEWFADAGAESFADRAGRELTATGETVRKRSSAPVTELTPQESQIARLAAAGQTNPEIGAVLFLSPRTVEWHLRKVFTKLGIASRRELAGALRVS